MAECVKFDYDFKSTNVKIFNSEGKLKKKYKCLGYMITFPLEYNYLLPDPYQEIPIHNDIFLKSKCGADSYLLYNIVCPYNYDQQKSIVAVSNNILEFKYLPYNYDFEVKILKIGTMKTLRFMYYNIYSTIASNMNDIYGEQTVYEIKDNTNIINFTITGEYHYFFTYSDAEIELKISKSNKKTPTYICDKKSCKCMCYEENNVGYIKLNNDDVPVYIAKKENSTITKYLYPQFSLLRELFLQETANNSLPIPEYISSPKNNQIIKYTDYKDLKTTVQFQPGYVRKFPETKALYQVSITHIGTPLVELKYGVFNFEKRLWQIEQKTEIDTKKYVYVYSWRSIDAVGSGYNPFANKLQFGIYAWKSGSWYIESELIYPKYGSNKGSTNLVFPTGKYRNENNRKWICFEMLDGGRVSYPKNIIVDITIEKRQ